LGATPKSLSLTGGRSNEIFTTLHTNTRFLKLIGPYRDDIVVGVECIFSWYWLADLCQAEGIPFILGHALYMKAIHGGRSKNDKIDSEKIAKLIRGGTFPLAHVYPQEMRATRDLLRRRNYFVHRRAELQAQIKLTNFQYNLPSITQKQDRRANRNDLAERFHDSSVRKKRRGGYPSDGLDGR
jgi:transposase